MTRIPKKKSKPPTGPLAPADVLLSASNKAAQGREDLELYRLFFERGPFPIWVFDPNSLRVLAINDAAVRHYGYSRKELLAMTMKDIRPAEDVPGFLEYVARAPDLPPRVWRECKKDGTMAFVEVTMQPVALGGGTALLALANDVSARVRAEKIRSRAETTLLIAQRIARLGNWYWNIETGELYWSSEIYRLFGVPETSAGANYETFLAAVHPDDRERVERAIRDALDRRAGYDLDHRVLRPDGTVLIVHEQGEVTRDGSGKALRMIGTVQDVTNRRHAEAELRQSEERYRILFEVNPMPMWVSDPETLSYLDVNQAAIEHYGFSRDEFLGMTLAGICPPEDVQQLHQYLASEKDGPLPVRVWRHRKKDGTIIEVEVTNHPVVYNGRRVRLSLGNDVTEQRRAERTLRRTQRLLDEGERIGQMGSWSYDLARNEISWSDQLYRLFGVSPESFQPTLKKIHAMIHPDERAEFLHNAKRAIRTRRSFERPYRVVRPDGEIRTLWQRVVVEGDPQRKPIRIYGSAQDITDLREAQAQLAEAQRVARIGSWNRDMRTGQITWSDELYRIFGISPETFTPDFEMLLAMVHPDDRERYVKERERAFVHGEPYQQVFRIVRSDGQTRVLRNHIEVEKDGAGNMLRVFGSSQDITELWEAEEQARKQASLLNLTHDAILVRDLQDRLTFWNRGAEHLYGWKKEEVLGRPVTEFLYGDVTAFAKAKHAVLTRGEWNGELRQLKNDGGEVVVGGRWTLVRNEQGEPECIISINSDLTEQKKLEQQFLRAQRLESIGTLASGVAHDLNNVLVPILMVAPLLRGEITTEEREKFLAIVEASAQRGANIVRQVLTFARGADGDRLLLQPIHLLEEISNIIRGTFPKSITVHLSYPETVSPIEGDPTQLHQVLLNLAVNARDAMPQGGALTLSVSNLNLDEYYAGMAPGIEPGPYVLLQVRDSGTGIPREIIDKIFDPFFTTKDIGVGTGLGLSTVLGIVKSHGGFVNVYSQPGETIFKIFLPAADTAQDLEKPKAAGPIASGHGEKILIVDDEPGIREIARALLEKHGYEPVVAEDGPGALAMFARHPREFKVVLTDYAIPIIDGVTLIRAMRKINPDIKAILSTGREDDCQDADIQTLGVQACLTKPYTREMLFETLHQVLNSE